MVIVMISLNFSGTLTYTKFSQLEQVWYAHIKGPIKIRDTFNISARICFKQAWALLYWVLLVVRGSDDGIFAV
jgi:hypothetical protein